MSRKVAIHQPNFIPWIGYFHKMSLVDEFILFDDVQFPRGKSYGNRVLIKANDNTLWLTIPVKSKSDLPQFREISIDYQSNWVRKMLKTIMLNYRKTEYFDFLFEDLSKVMEKEHARLIDLNSELIRLCHQKIGLKSKLSFSSEISSDNSLSGNEKILDLLRKTKADIYISGKGSGSKRYIDENEFRDKGISLEWQEIKNDYSYKQSGNSFIPNLSIIDLIFNEGPGAMQILNAL